VAHGVQLGVSPALGRQMEAGRAGHLRGYAVERPEGGVVLQVRVKWPPLSVPSVSARGQGRRDPHFLKVVAGCDLILYIFGLLSAFLFCIDRITYAARGSLSLSPSLPPFLPSSPRDSLDL